MLKKKVYEVYGKNIYKIFLSFSTCKRCELGYWIVCKCELDSFQIILFKKCLKSMWRKNLFPFIGILVFEDNIA